MQPYNEGLLRDFITVQNIQTALGFTDECGDSHRAFCHIYPCNRGLAASVCHCGIVHFLPAEIIVLCPSRRPQAEINCAILTFIQGVQTVHGKTSGICVVMTAEAVHNESGILPWLYLKNSG